MPSWPHPTSRRAARAAPGVVGGAFCRPLMPSAHHFPPPWSVEEPRLLTVYDANGQALAYVYFEDEPGPTRGFGHSI